MKQLLTKKINRSIAAVCILGTALSASSSLGGALEKKIVSADAKWLLHLDVDALLKSKVGSYVHESVLEPKMQLQRSMIEGMLGVSLKPELVHSITIYGDNFQNEPQLHAVALIRTEIDIPTIVKKVQEFQNLEAAQSGKEVDAKIKLIQSKPYAMYWMKGDNGEDVYFANPSGNLWNLTLDKSKLESSVAIIQGKALNLESSADLKNLSPDNQSVLFLAMAKGFNESAPLPPQAQILKMAENASMTLGETNDHIQARLTLAARTNEAATQMTQLAQGMIALLTLSQSENPDVMELARNTSVTQKDSKVSLTVKYSIDKALAKIKEEVK